MLLEGSSVIHWGDKLPFLTAPCYSRRAQTFRDHLLFKAGISKRTSRAGPARGQVSASVAADHPCPHQLGPGHLTAEAEVDTPLSSPACVMVASPASGTDPPRSLCTPGALRHEHTFPGRC